MESRRRWYKGKAFGRFSDTAVWGALASGLVLLILVVSLFSSPELAGTDPRFLPPGPAHWFGTDHMGRDLFIRTITGFRYTFLCAAAAQLPTFVCGALLGTFLGYAGNKADEFFFYLFNIILSFPTVLAAIFLSLYLGRGIHTAIAAAVLFGIVYNVKLVRAEIQKEKNSDYVIALRLNGISGAGIVWRHLLPRAFYLLLPLLPLMIGHTMLGISALSFLGLGVRPPTPELGIILKDSLRFAGRAPQMIILPGLFQFSVVFVLSLWSDALERGMQEKCLGGLKI